MLPKCMPPSDYYPSSKRKSTDIKKYAKNRCRHGHKDRWRCLDVASLRRKLSPKICRFIVIVTLAILLPRCCKAFSLNHGGFSNGDPAPGRSPGPPRGADFSSDEYLQVNFDEDSDDANHSNESVISEVKNATIPPPITARPESIAKDTAPKEHTDGEQSAKEDACKYKDSKFDGDVKVIEVDESSLNLTFSHSVFKSTVELVRGLTYEVVLTPLDELEELSDFLLDSLIDEQERGEFTSQNVADPICIFHRDDNVPIPSEKHHQQPKKPTILQHEQNTERNDLPLWETLNFDTNNDILEDYKLENDSDRQQRLASRGDDETDVNIEDSASPKDSEKSVNRTLDRDVKNDDTRNRNPSFDKTYTSDTGSREKRNARERDASNFLYSSDINNKLSGFYVDRNNAYSDLMKKEVVKGHQIYGRFGEHKRKIEFRWQLTDASLGEEKLANVTFRLRYRKSGDLTIYQVFFVHQIRLECQLSLYRMSGRLSWSDLPRSPTDCQVFFPSASAQRRGLLVTLERLNVPCLSGGFIRLNPGSPLSSRLRTHQHNALCGKLEELPDSERHFYFSASQTKTSPFLHVHGSPLFLIHYKLVDYCYNVTLTARNGSFEIEPTNSLHCTFKIHLPFGNRVALRLQMGDKPIKGDSKKHATSTSSENLINELQHTKYSSLSDTPKQNHTEPECPGLSINLWDVNTSWIHCSIPGNALRNVQIISTQNSVIIFLVIRRTSKSVDLVNSASSKKINPIDGDKSVVKNIVINSDTSVNSLMSSVNKRSVSSELHDLKVDSESADSGGGDSGMFLRLWYHAEPISEVVGQCSYGWVSLRQFCVSVFEHAKLPWAQAEAECIRQGGHLASIRSEQDQAVVDQLLLLSPGYKENSAYWVGASDKTSEGDFRWTDGLPFTFSHWFPGWTEHGGYNKQPNDDGLSGQDCVEIRRAFRPPAPAPSRLTASFRWNDRDCGAPNHFLCERALAEEAVEMGVGCEASITLSRARPRAVLASPGFPRHYPDAASCETEVVAPPAHHIVLDFEELVLENEPDCSYDYLEISEPPPPPGIPYDPDDLERRFCGDWSARLKLLRHVSLGPNMKLRFVSDYSHHYTGFKATLTMESGLECADDRQKLFNNSCYSIVSYPEVTWHTAQQICRGTKSQLASILSPEEQKFITSSIRNSAEYSTSAIYWLGAKISDVGKYDWIDGARTSFSGWLPGQSPDEMDILEVPDPQSLTCLGMQWKTSPTPMLPSGLYWTSQKCAHVGGYVCKRKNLSTESDVNVNKTVNDTEGRLMSPNYPATYPNKLNYRTKLVGPDMTRLVVQFSKIDLEYQKECLYDYVEVRSIVGGKDQNDDVRWCGTHDTDMRRFDFVSKSNEVSLTVHTDHSIGGAGFSGGWRAVDVSACPSQTLTAKEGSLKSPNYPNFLLERLDCAITIMAPPGKRVWLEILDFDMDQDSAVFEVELGDGPPIKPFLTPARLADGAFLSTKETMLLRFRTDVNPIGTGFTAVYKTVGFAEEERVLELSNSSSGIILHVNHPRAPPLAADLSLRLIAPSGYTLLLKLYGLIFSDEEECSDGRGKIEVFDSYADTNGTWWGLCETDGPEEGPPLAITSFMSSLRIRQRSNHIGVKLNATIRTQMDVNYRMKLLQGSQDSSVEGCRPNPCLNGGRCLTTNGRSTCQCFGHFTGMFCALTACELEPCVFGACVLTNAGHKCVCRPGYTGVACGSRARPCQARPCEGRGRCTERPGGGFHCNCYAWWEGTRCERRMMNIPYKPLSERMLQEPFWLGLITVFVVLAVIGLVWCAKRHFPEKIEKLLAEEADRSRGPNQVCLRGTSARETCVPGTQGAGTVAGAAAAGGVPPRGSLLNRLGIRKPSILSLTASPHAPAPPTARTFSLDDLLKPPPRRTPSPRKKRNNSTPTKKNAAEKKQILQQLISPAPNQNHARKVSMGELIQMSERRAKESEEGKLRVSSPDNRETTFMNGDRLSTITSPTIRQLSDPKLEKKVTFARLLNKVSAEMSSGSEIEIGNLTVHQDKSIKSASTPPSPAAEYNMRSPHSTSSNQGSDSISSLETALPGMGLRKFSGRTSKISSADSILAMFRNFSSTAVTPNMPSSIVVSPSTTPSASSPQDDAAGDDESTTSSLHTPVSFSSGAPDSPVFYRQSNSQSNTIEVPVLDALTAHKAGASGCNLLHPPTILLEIPSSINKCLSPIRELPTPLPSPALTPIMQRSTTSPADYDDLGLDMSDDHISLEIPCISQTEDEDDNASNQDISVIPRDGAQSGVLDISSACSSPSNIRLKMRPPPIGRDTPTPSTQITDDTPSPVTQSHDSERELSSSCGRTTASPQELSPARPALIIPLLTVEQPSPTRHYSTGFMFTGSPPPQRASIGETSFHFPNKQQQKRLLKEFEKPTSLDLANAPPMITITCNMSEAESDAESVSPATRPPGQSLAPPGPSTMCYLSPFSICTRGDRTTSESNLSSSGYSSMASPGPSRCGSNNPLCPSEMEDPGPGSGPTNLHPHRRPSPLLKTNSNPSSSSANNNTNEQKGHCRGRSDSETLSDDPLLESNDEGISTDHLEERIEEGELKSAKELEVFLKNEPLDCDKTLLMPINHSPNFLQPKMIAKCGSIEKSLDRLTIPTIVPTKMSLQLPSIVIQTDTSPVCDKVLSPVSSRSESPLSDRTTGLGRFSPYFYCRHRELPFTDSDGLYDFPSSDCVHQNSSGGNKLNINVASQPHRKSTGRRRERKNSRTNTGSKTPSPTKSQLPHSLQNLLDVPGKDVYFRTPAPRKLSPKRRSRSQQPVSSSSSSESLNSAREVTVRLSPDVKSPQSVEAGAWPKQEWAAEASGEETGEEQIRLKNKIGKSRSKLFKQKSNKKAKRFLRVSDASIKMLPKSPLPEENAKPVRKISRMRTIGHQIRFLRRLEQSLKQRERFATVGNSDEEGDESSSVTSPLLQQSRTNKPQIRKSQSIGRIQPTGSTNVPIRGKITRQKKGNGTSDLLLSQENLWRGNLGMAGPNDISD